MRSNFQITISGLLLLTLMVSVIVAGASFLIRAQDQNRTAMILFFPFVLAAPMATMIVVAAFLNLVRWIRRNKR